MSKRNEGSSNSLDKSLGNLNNEKNIPKENIDVKNELSKEENNPNNIKANSIKDISNESDSNNIEYSIEQIDNPIDKVSDIKKFNLERIQKFDLEYKNKYYSEYYELNFYSNSINIIDSYENQEISLSQFNQTKFLDLMT